MIFREGMITGYPGDYEHDHHLQNFDRKQKESHTKGIS